MHFPAAHLLALSALFLVASALSEGRAHSHAHVEVNATLRAGGGAVRLFEAPVPFGLRAAQVTLPAELPPPSPSPSPWAWSRVEATAKAGAKPGPRQNHAAVEVGRLVYVHGGCLQELQCYGDLWVFDTDSFQWSQANVQGPEPAPRGGHSGTLIGSELFIYGGASPLQTFGDVFKLDLIKREWAQGYTIGSARVPGKRTGHAATSDGRGHLFVFGGYSGQGSLLNDLWMLRAVEGARKSHTRGVFEASWVKLPAFGNVPSPRSGHSLTLYGRKLLLFGGVLESGKVSNELFVYDLDSQTWVPFALDGVSPAPRQGHAALRHGSEIAVVGGCDTSEEKSTCYNDAWSFSPIDMQWTPRTSDAITWFARSGHSATFSRGKMFTFGGCQLFRECYSDVAALDTLDACPNRCGGNGECVPTDSGPFCRCTAPGFTGHDCMDPLICEQDCGRHGQCLESGSCMCENGWAGDDCSKELTCPSELGRKCGGRGMCLDSGKCHCRDGWTGPVCTVRSGAAFLVEPQPLARPGGASSACLHGCCGRGLCDEASGECRCGAGWYGPACTINGTGPASAASHRNATHKNATAHHNATAFVQRRPPPPPSAAVLARAARRRLLAEAGKKRLEMRRKQRDLAILQQLLPKVRASSDHTERVKAEMLKLSSEVASLRSQAAAADRKAAAHEEREHRAHRKAVALINAATSACEVQQQPAGHAKKLPDASASDFGFETEADHSEKMDCPDSCNFHGLCSGGTCYCQPGFYGRSCGSVRVDSKTTVSLPLTLAVSGAIFLSTGITTCVVTNWFNPDVASAERELGYV
mmetsp:Transcript_3978/g.11502  ORF Transcript_3978/g.11502 Transcript_3978/m.11502 type:complete len:812 (+) Transcript_3978:116-2551(+)